MMDGFEFLGMHIHRVRSEIGLDWQKKLNATTKLNRGGTKNLNSCRKNKWSANLNNHRGFKSWNIGNCHISCNGWDMEEERRNETKDRDNMIYDHECTQWTVKEGSQLVCWIGMQRIVHWSLAPCLKLYSIIKMRNYKNNCNIYACKRHSIIHVMGTLNWRYQYMYRTSEAPISSTSAIRT